MGRFHDKFTPFIELMRKHFTWDCHMRYCSIEVW